MAAVQGNLREQASILADPAVLRLIRPREPAGRPGRLPAQLADFQPQDDVRVYLDPAGHPFCLWAEPSSAAESA